MREDPYRTHMLPICIPVAKPILIHMGYRYRTHTESHMGPTYESHIYCLLGCRYDNVDIYVVTYVHFNTGYKRGVSK